MIHQEILLSEFWLQIERRFDPRRRFTGQMLDVKGICQEGCYVSLHYGLSFQKTKITKQKTCYRILQVFPFLQFFFTFFIFFTKNIIIFTKVYQSMVFKGLCLFLLWLFFLQRLKDSKHCGQISSTTDALKLRLNDSLASIPTISHRTHSPKTSVPVPR